MPTSFSTRISTERLRQHLRQLRRDALEGLEEVEWQVHHLENDLIRLGEDLREPVRALADAARERALDRSCPLVRAVTRRDETRDSHPR